MGNDDTNLLIRLRPKTRAKFDCIAKSRRWTLSETADAIADEFMVKHDITGSDESTGTQGGGNDKTHK